MLNNMKCVKPATPRVHSNVGMFLLWKVTAWVPVK